MSANAIPLIAAAVTTGGSLWSAHKAGQLNPAEKGAQQTQQRAGNALEQTGARLTGYGMPKLEQAGTYFSTLAGGNRAATQQALAPDVANINAVYGGTQRTLARFLRGPDRDFQLGELARQRAGATGSLFSAARARGVEGLVQLGQYGTSQGAAATSGAAGVAGGVGAQGFANRQAGNQMTEEAGRNAGSLIFQLLQGYKGGGVGGGKIPQIPLGPRNLPSLPGTIPTTSPIQGLGPISSMGGHGVPLTSNPYGGIRF